MKYPHVVVAGSLLVAACGEKLPVDKPPAPDMSAVVNDYREPTAALAEVTVTDVVDGLTDRFGFLKQIGACTDDGECGSPSVLGETLGGEGTESDVQQLSPGVEQRRDAIRIGGIEVEGEGFVRLKRVCDGWSGTGEVDAAKTGLLTLTAGFTDAGLDPVIWGSFARCLMLSGEVEQFLDGQLNLFIGANLQFEQLTRSAMLLQFANFRFGQDVADLVGFDFRVSPDGGFELMVPLPAGLHVLFYIREGAFGFRATDGDWGCDLSLANLGTGLCTKGGEQVAW